MNESAVLEDKWDSITHLIPSQNDKHTHSAYAILISINHLQLAKYHIIKININRMAGLSTLVLMSRMCDVVMQKFYTKDKTRTVLLDSSLPAHTSHHV